MYRDLGFIRVWGSQADGPDGRDTGGAPYAYLIYPHGRSSPTWPRPIGCSASTAWSSWTRPALRQRPTARLRRRAGQVDGADRRRAAPDRDGEHAPARAPARSGPGDAGPVAAGAVGARPDARTPRGYRRPASRIGDGPRGTRRGPVADARHSRASPRPQAPQPRADRGARAGRGPRLAEGDRLRRRGPLQAAGGGGQHLDRDDALQLPPAGARREGQGGHPRGRRNADGAQHDRDLRRDHDGNARDASLARQPRADRRFDRAGLRCPHVRRGDGDLRLRQDNSRPR